jgi:hypothetical protein
MAHFAVRYDAAIKRWYSKKCANGLTVVAVKAVAHKLARACWHVMKDGKPFEVWRTLGWGLNDQDRCDGRGRVAAVSLWG